MDSEKKPKRPRIGSVPPAGFNEEGNEETRYEKVNYPNDEKRNDPQRQNYQQRQGFHNRFQGNYQNGKQGYQRNQGYQNYQGYQPYPGAQQNNELSDHGNDVENTSNDQPVEVYQPRQGVYQPRQNYQRPNYNNYQNRQGGYQNRQGNYNQRGYNQGYNRNNQGNYQNRQGGYNQGGYNQGGYNQGHNQNNQGGYQTRQGGYNQGYNRNQGGYQNRQGGYNHGGYNQGGYNQGGYRKAGNNMKFTPRPKQIDYIIDDIDPNEEVRLNKYMANAGICSRREADEYISKGLVKVNGEVTTELGTKIKRDDVVEFDEKVVVPERKCYVLLNKPKDCVTTSDDPNGRITVLDIVKNACKERIYPVGRLDRNTTGVLLLTNDGDLASKLTHPKFVKKKIYHVWTDKDISEEDMQRIADGIELPDGEIHADAISYVSETDKNQAGIEIHSGRNRIVRRIFEHLGYRVTKLDRVYFAGLTKKNLPRGRWRYLTQEEVTALRTGRFE
ncbi:MAG: RNA-binding S4 domain-containing protein [Muribaculaceae bacterium]|nr:RNA-binding S4 domain-containing protein [Muribaculaceae bacterium]